ncbi:hypothetical protein HDV03_005509 [Kappamyces sp. JEL0829]|nr:hypothetical protein HDV03_005509 [Kappamyces sp. JEL0829]
MQSVDEAEPQQPSEGEPTKLKRGKYACTHCKRRRRRCTGLPAPCESCVKLQVECTFEIHKKRGPNMDKIKEMKRRVLELERLLEVERMGNKAEPSVVHHSDETIFPVSTSLPMLKGSSADMQSGNALPGTLMMPSTSLGSARLADEVRNLSFDGTISDLPVLGLDDPYPPASPRTIAETTAIQPNTKELSTSLLELQSYRGVLSAGTGTIGSAAATVPPPLEKPVTIPQIPHPTIFGYEPVQTTLFGVSPTNPQQLDPYHFLTSDSVPSNTDSDSGVHQTSNSSKKIVSKDSHQSLSTGSSSMGLQYPATDSSLSGLNWLSTSNLNDFEIFSTMIPYLDESSALPEPISNQSLGFARDQDPSDWTALTFYCIQMSENDGSIVSFLDYYFIHAYKTFPWLQKTWVMEHLAEIPLFLLHAMYAFCLTCSTPYQVSDFAYRHYKCSLKAIHADLETADPFTVCALLHNCHFAKFMRDQCGVYHYSLAIGLATHMKLYDPSYHWLSMLGNSLHLPYFTLGMWFSMYALDYAGTQVFDVPLLIDLEIDTNLINQFSLPDNSGYSFALVETNMSLYRYQIPLITLGRRLYFLQKNTVFNLSQQLHILSEFDAWFEKLPEFLKINLDDTDWKGRGSVWMNAMYHSNRLKILKPQFLMCLEQSVRQGFWVTDIFFQKCVFSMNSMTTMASIFHNCKPQGFQSQSSVLQSCIYFSALFHCALACVTGQLEPMKIAVAHHLMAIRMSYAGQDVERLEECILNPIKAVELLRSGTCWETLKTA